MQGFDLGTMRHCRVIWSAASNHEKKKMPHRFTINFMSLAALQ